MGTEPTVPLASVGTPQVRASIARAAAATGNDFDFLLAQARLESSLNPSARAGTSSASGLYQFTGNTWLRMVDRHGSQHGLGWADAAIESGAIRDPATRAQVMALRFDPDASALMAGELTTENRAGLTAALGRSPDNAELYLAHFLGLDGATKFLSAMTADPTQSAAALLPKAAGANRAVFYDGSGNARSLGGVMDLLRGKLASAMGDAPANAWVEYQSAAAAPATGPAFAGGPIAQAFHAAAAQAPAAARRVSMADTLRSAFGGSGSGDGGAMPAQVSAAYARLSALGL